MTEAITPTTPPKPPQKHGGQAQVVAKGTGISFVGTVAFRGLNYLLSVVVARFLGSSMYGLFAFGVTNVNLSRLFALLGLDFGVNRYVARFRAQENPAAERRLVRTLLAIVIVWGILLAIGFIFFAAVIAQRSDQDPEMATRVLRWFAPAIPLAGALYFLTSAADGQRRVIVGTIARDTLRPGLTILLASILLFLGGDLIGVVYTYVIAMFLAFLVSLLFLRKYFIPNRNIPGNASQFSLKEVLNFSLPIFPAKFLREVGNQLEIFLLGYLATTADVGIFSAAARTAVFVAFGLQAVMRIYNTLAAELHTKGDMKQLESLQHLATRWSTTFSLPALIAIILLGDEILALFGRDFTGFKTVLVILALGQAINAASGPVSGTLHMAGYSRVLLMNSAIAVTTNIALDWWLIGRYGVLGAAIGSAIVMVLINLLAVVEVQYLLGIRSFGRSLLRPAFVGLITYTITWGILSQLTDVLPILRLGIGLACIGLLFGGLYWRVAPDEDKELALNAIKRLRKRGQRQKQ